MNTHNLGYTPNSDLVITDVIGYEFDTDAEANMALALMPSGLVDHQVTLPNGEQTRPVTNGEAWLAHKVNRAIILVFWGIRTP